LAPRSDEALARVFNLADRVNFSQAGWFRLVGGRVGVPGEIGGRSEELMPPLSL
jgi:hypothetical protein